MLNREKKGLEEYEEPAKTHLRGDEVTNVRSVCAMSVSISLISARSTLLSSSGSLGLTVCWQTTVSTHTNVLKYSILQQGICSNST